MVIINFAKIKKYLNPHNTDFFFDFKALFVGHASSRADASVFRAIFKKIRFFQFRYELLHLSVAQVADGQTIPSAIHPDGFHERFTRTAAITVQESNVFRGFELQGACFFDIHTVICIYDLAVLEPSFLYRVHILLTAVLDKKNTLAASAWVPYCVNSG